MEWLDGSFLGDKWSLIVERLEATAYFPFQIYQVDNKNFDECSSMVEHFGTCKSGCRFKSYHSSSFNKIQAIAQLDRAECHVHALSVTGSSPVSL